MNRPLRILQISTSDGSGGAQKVAYGLHQSYLEYGHRAWLAVGNKRTVDPDVIPIPVNGGGVWQRLWAYTEGLLTPLEGRVRGTRRARQWLRLIGQLKKLLEIHQGHENFEFPGSRRILELLSEIPDIIQCHNLHGGYFDLRALPWLSQQAPTVLTLHDAWLLGGHCAHSFVCERWKTGCGQCPDLTIYPAIKRDATAYNWRRKRRIYSRSQVYVATPSNWLMQKVEQSILCTASLETRVIPNGVDLSVFCPADMRTTRAALGIQQDVKALLFVSKGTRAKVWKDAQMMQAIISSVTDGLEKQKSLLIVLGEDAPPENTGGAEIRFISYQEDLRSMAAYYQSADVYVHTAKVDTFPNTVLEALACGTPVVATAVGGIPEQVKSLNNFTVEQSKNPATHCVTACQGFTLEEATGVLVPPGDVDAMAGAIRALLTDKALRRRLGVNAARDARQRFDLLRQAHDYLAWYQEIIECRDTGRISPSRFTCNEVPVQRPTKGKRPALPLGKAG